MNELIIGVVGSLIATLIVSVFSRGERQDEAGPHRFRWFWRLSFLLGKLSFFYGLIVIIMNLAVNTPAMNHNIAAGSIFFLLGLIAWLMGYLFR